MEVNHAQQAARIAELNDQCRATIGLNGGRLVITQGIRALSTATIADILDSVRRFNSFTPGDNPYDERDFGAFEHADERILWKIDYYDPTLTEGSDDPTDPQKTTRVLTVMLASEY